MTVETRLRSLEANLRGEADDLVILPIGMVEEEGWRAQFAMAVRENMVVRVIRGTVGESTSSQEEAEAIVAKHRATDHEFSIVVRAKDDPHGPPLEAWEAHLPEDVRNYPKLQLDAMQ